MYNDILRDITIPWLLKCHIANMKFILMVEHNDDVNLMLSL